MIDLNIIKLLYYYFLKDGAKYQVRGHEVWRVAGIHTGRLSSTTKPPYEIDYDWAQALWPYIEDRK